MLNLILFGFIIYNAIAIIEDIKDRREARAKKDPLYHYYSYP